MLKQLDTHHSGKINYSQFVTMLSDRSKLFARKSLVEAFVFLDANRSGFLELQELREALRGSSELNCILQDLDANED